MFSSDLRPDPDSSVDVLAFILCPLTAFTQSSDPEEMDAVREIIGSVKEEAARRWHESRSAKRRN